MPSAEKCYCVTMRKDDNRWILLEWDRYEKEPDLYAAPLEVVKPQQIPEAEFMVRQMNRNPRGANFWQYNAQKQLPVGGRLAYAKMAMVMADARAKEQAGGGYAAGRNTVSG